MPLRPSKLVCKVSLFLNELPRYGEVETNQSVIVDASQLATYKMGLCVRCGHRVFEVFKVFGMQLAS